MTSAPASMAAITRDEIAAPLDAALRTRSIYQPGRARNAIRRRSPGSSPFPDNPLRFPCEVLTPRGKRLPYPRGTTNEEEER
jgi:hypothetical protein